MKTERGETIISIIVAIAIGVLCVFTIAWMNNKSDERWKTSTNIKAYCDSIGGHYGVDKCYVNGEEMPSGGEE